MSRGLDWRWIGIGVAIMFGLNLVASLILTLLLGDAYRRPRPRRRRPRRPSAPGASPWVR